MVNFSTIKQLFLRFQKQVISKKTEITLHHLKTEILTDLTLHKEANQDLFTADLDRFRTLPATTIQTKQLYCKLKTFKYCIRINKTPVLMLTNYQ